MTDLVVTEDRVTGEPPGRRGRERAGGGPDGRSGVDLADLNAALVGAGVRVRGFGVERASLEDAFVALTGEGFDVAG